MSGHSHFSSIKHKKEITDAKRGKIFSKLARQISVAVREKGSDPETNSGLRLVIEKAKSVNMPKDNIERAIKRGTGELAEEKLEEVMYEAYGPGGIAIIIEGITDNKNRALGEIKQILNQAGGKLADSGSVKWMFERKGAIIIEIPKSEIRNPKFKENLELKVIEAGADDIYWHNETLDVYTKPEDLEKVKKNLEEQGIRAESASLDWVAKDEIKLEEKEAKAAERLFELLDENEAVQEIYSNLKT
ncbi:YebC/PmpR family DNA-binding transcriptional regulator [Candidatus Parcubacteria bacterium]|nr:YebC/PmpR family DNA-binding transcriptional regulator [Candidatus Parcubacteria bacterium]